MSKIEKTNAVRLLEATGAHFELHDYSSSGAISGEEVAAALGQATECVFKTLVTIGASGNHYVFMVPVCMELDLRKAASAAGEKKVEMVKARELLPLTGYVHGGCSPLGMKKAFATFIDETAELCDRICFSGGRIGLQIETAPADLADAVSKSPGQSHPLVFADICG